MNEEQANPTLPVAPQNLAGDLIPEVEGASDIVPLPELEQYTKGQVWCDTRAEVIERVAASIKRLRKDGVVHRKSPAPDQVHVRVLCVTPEYLEVIAIEDPRAMSEKIPMQDALGHVRSGEWVLAKQEPVPAVRMLEGSLSKTARNRRDNDYELIRPVVELGDGMFDPKERWAKIREISETRRLGPAAIYRRLRRFWQGGMQKNALVGRWFRRKKRCGFGALQLTITEVKAGQLPIRVGRPRADGKPSFHSHEGFRKIVLRGARDFLYKPRGGSPKIAWLKTVARDFLPDLNDLTAEEVEVRLTKVAPNQYPSLRTFKRWISNDKALISRLKAQWSEKVFNLRFRSLNAKTEDKVTGPGAAFQIDATRADIILVHQITRRPIGRAVVYVVVDCWSHMVVGYYIHLKNAGYDPAALALLAAAEDKVQLAARFGKKITRAEWASACLPEDVIADSELASGKAHVLVDRRLINSLTITSPYRADLKGLVESLHNAITKSTLMHLDGYSTGVRKRAVVDPCAEAVLDYMQLNLIVINWVLQTNRHGIKGYHKTEAMLLDPEFGAVNPRNLWAWGIGNTSGKRRHWEQSLLEELLLPRANARVTRWGLEYKDLVYAPIDGELPEFESWKVEAGATRSWNETIVYHPDSLNHASLCHEGRLVKLRLADVKDYRGRWSWADHIHDRVEESIKASAQESIDTPVIAYLEGEKERIRCEAVAQTTEKRGTVAKRRREKFDIEAERRDQQQRVDGTAHPPPKSRRASPPDAMARQDEQEIFELRNPSTTTNAS